MQREELVTKTPVLQGDPNLAEEKREEIRVYFHKTFTLYEKLFETIANNEAYFYKADRLRHPLIFYFGHTATFFINKLVLAKILSVNERVNPHLESTCAVGVDEMSWDDLNTENYDWPTVKDVKNYRKQVREVVDSVIRTVPCTLPIVWESPLWCILMGIEHERIHLETSSVLIRQLALKDVVPHSLFRICDQVSETAPENDLISIEGGEVCLGKDMDHPCYGWDNEYGSGKADVPSFAASKFLVSNKEFFEFVDSGGYSNQSYWTEAGWNWVTFKKAKFPTFWVHREGDFKLRLMTEEIPLPWNWPAEVNFLESYAFCQWKSEKTGKKIRLPTEEEYYHLTNLMTEKEDQYSWKKAPGNVNLEYWASPCPVDYFRSSDDPHELYDIVGNVWQWTHTPMYPLNGFKVHPLYDDFTTPTFDNLHQMIKGGSWISTGNEATLHARYAFRQHFFQHAGFRYIESENPPKQPEEAVPFEKDMTICEPIHSQFNLGEKFGIKNFSVQVAESFLQFLKDVNEEENEDEEESEAQQRESACQDKPQTILEVGCLGGRTCFEIVKNNPNIEVTGIDLTVRLVKVGHRLQEMKNFRYEMKDEGELVKYCSISLDDIGVSKEMSEKVTLIQNDPCNIYSRLKDFDAILVSDLARLYDPGHLLRNVHDRLKPGGLLYLVCSNDWDTKTTPYENWLGGKKVDGESYTTEESISQILHKRFSPILDFELPKATQCTTRTTCITNNQISVWKRE